MDKEYIERILLPEAERKTTITTGIYVDKLEELIAFLIELDYKTRKNIKLYINFALENQLKE